MLLENSFAKLLNENKEVVECCHWQLVISPREVQGNFRNGRKSRKATSVNSFPFRWQTDVFSRTKDWNESLLDSILMSSSQITHCNRSLETSLIYSPQRRTLIICSLAATWNREKFPFIFKFVSMRFLSSYFFSKKGKFCQSIFCLIFLWRVEWRRRRGGSLLSSGNG